MNVGRRGISTIVSALWGGSLRVGRKLRKQLILPPETKNRRTSGKLRAFGHLGEMDRTIRRRRRTRDIAADSRRVNRGTL